MSRLAVQLAQTYASQRKNAQRWHVGVCGGRIGLALAVDRKLPAFRLSEARLVPLHIYLPCYGSIKSAVRGPTAIVRSLSCEWRVGDGGITNDSIIKNADKLALTSPSK